MLVSYTRRRESLSRVPVPILWLLFGLASPSTGSSPKGSALLPECLPSLSFLKVETSLVWRLSRVSSVPPILGPAELTATILGAERFFWYPGSAMCVGGCQKSSLSISHPKREGEGCGREKPPHLALGGTVGGYLSTRK